MQVRRGDVFSRKMVTATTELMSLRLGQDGYAFAKIDPVPKENAETKEIELTFLVDPGNRAYVRHITFSGTTGINDEVLRREMRQMEGGYLSNAAVDRSKLRLQRLPYIEKVEVETNPVPGTPDLVDVNYEIKEGLPGQFSGGVGYSESQSFLLNGSFVHSNFMGTGNRVAAELNAGQYSKVLQPVAHRPVHHDRRRLAHGLGHLAPDRRSSRSRRPTSRPRPARSAVDYGWPISEFQSVRVGLSAQRSDLFTDPNSSAAEALDWVQNNGNPYTEVSLVGVPPIGLTYYGTKFDTFETSVGWSFDSRNRALFADRGARHRLGASYTLPGSDVEFYTLNYDYLQFMPARQVADVHVQQRGRLRQGAGRHHLDAAVPELLRRRPGDGARLPREPAGPEGLLRQPLRRQHQVHQPGRAAAADARKVAQQRAFQPVFRHRQRVLRPKTSTSSARTA